MYQPTYLEPYEVVDQWVFSKYGKKSFEFFDDRILRLADWLRVELGTPMWCNNWYFGGNLDSRGLRQSTNDEHTVMSAHTRGQALDLSFSGYQAEQVRDFIEDNWDRVQEDIGLKSLTIEKDVSWLHIAVTNGEEGLNYFYPQKKEG